MSNLIELIEIGLNGQELVDKINEIISAINDMQNITSYNNLSDKPVINGITLQGSKTLQQMGVTMRNLPDYEEVMGDVLTTEDQEGVNEEAVAAAEEAVSIGLGNKIDKNINDLPALDKGLIQGNETVVINKAGTLFKMEMKDVLSMAYTYSKNAFEKGGTQIVTQDDEPAIAQGDYWFDVEN